MFRLWWLMPEEDRLRVWRLYGWFSGLMMCGSCVGAVAWLARMIQLENVFKAPDKPQSSAEWSLVAYGYSWRPSFSVMYAITFLCLSAAKLMVLQRMSDFVAPQGHGLRKRWFAAGRILMAVVVLGNAVGLAASIAAAVHYQKASVAASMASAYSAANKSKLGDSSIAEHFNELQHANKIASAQAVCEVCVLLLIVAAFVIVGVLCARIFASKLLQVDAASAVAASGRALQLQVTGTIVAVFVAFLLRSAFATMYAVTYQLQDFDKICLGDFCDSTCYNVYALTLEWMFKTPEFQLMIELISSPLAMLVALWGMSTKSTLQLMKRRMVLTNNRQEPLVPQNL
jgi:hypothetical protein